MRFALPSELKLQTTNRASSPLPCRVLLLLRPPLPPPRLLPRPQQQQQEERPRSSSSCSRAQLWLPLKHTQQHRMQQQQQRQQQQQQQQQRQHRRSLLPLRSSPPWPTSTPPRRPRSVVPPLAGVDVSPVVWVALLSFVSEILVGPQGILILLSRKVGGA